MKRTWEEYTEIEGTDVKEPIIQIKNGPDDGQYNYWHIMHGGKPCTIAIHSDYDGVMCVPTMITDGHMTTIEMLEDAIDFMKEESKQLQAQSK